ncbi:MAG: pilus assembly FimT family protein [Planctomycetota bacterium]|jgi:prepilin-type N-terminal cleavage/methylation domain-containing protein
MEMITMLKDSEISIRKNAFTIVEIIVVMVILSIAAVLAVPMISSAADVQVRSAANMIAADLDYAKSMAISRQQNHTVVFDIANESYEVRDANGDVIEHPIKGGSDFVVDLQSDGRLSRVDVVGADFDPDSKPSVTFDYLGSPYSGTDTADSLNSGVITLQAGTFSMTVIVEPMTGYVTVQ